MIFYFDFFFFNLEASPEIPVMLALVQACGRQAERQQQACSNSQNT